MAISDKLTKLAEDITASYNAVQAKGGNVPANKNTNNLPAAISSIEGGGSGVMSDSWPGLGQRENIPAEYEQIDYVTVEDGAYCYAQSAVEATDNSDNIFSYSATASVKFPGDNFDPWNTENCSWPVFVPKSQASGTSCYAGWSFFSGDRTQEGVLNWDFSFWKNNHTAEREDPTVMLYPDGFKEWKTFYVNAPNYSEIKPSTWTATTSSGMTFGQNGGALNYTPRAYTVPTLIGQAGGVKLAAKQDAVRYYNIRGFESITTSYENPFNYISHPYVTAGKPINTIPAQYWKNLRTSGNFKFFHENLWPGGIVIGEWREMHGSTSDWATGIYYDLYDMEGNKIPIAVEPLEKEVDVTDTNPQRVRVWHLTLQNYLPFYIWIRTDATRKFKLAQNMKIDFVPVRRKSDNVVGFYDVINSVFHESLGTVPFKGPGE